MMGADQVADFIAGMVEAQMRGDRPAQIAMLDRLLRRPRGDSMAVALTMAGTVGDGGRPLPGEDFHRLRVTHLGPDGTRCEGSVDDLPPHIATFARIVVAMQNGDRGMARDLFAGYVGDDGHRALHVLAFGLSQVLHSVGACSCYRPAPGDGGGFL